MKFWFIQHDFAEYRLWGGKRGRFSVLTLVKLKKVGYKPNDKFRQIRLSGRVLVDGANPCPQHQSSSNRFPPGFGCLFITRFAKNNPDSSIFWTNIIIVVFAVVQDLKPIFFHCSMFNLCYWIFKHLIVVIFWPDLLTKNIWFLIFFICSLHTSQNKMLYYPLQILYI